ncbi:MAG: hypothetical protein IJN32_07755, partial [Thermoguttaceae bacterium]|nr:hypothetical protein [Thermoguttaceae bacterium]
MRPPPFFIVGRWAVERRRERNALSCDAILAFSPLQVDRFRVAPLKRGGFILRFSGFALRLGGAFG